MKDNHKVPNVSLGTSSCNEPPIDVYGSYDNEEFALEDSLQKRTEIALIVCVVPEMIAPM